MSTEKITYLKKISADDKPWILLVILENLR